jgi:NAD(P)H dehydrogenase (quinone)
MKSGARKEREAFARIPTVALEDLVDADALIFGTPTRFGNMCSQMRNFLDQTGGLWARGALAGKIGSVFVSTGSQHGGQETTLTSFHNTLFHHGMMVLGAPIGEKRMATMDEITGGTPYGASTLAGPDGRSRTPSQNELEIARSQGRYVADVAAQLVAGRSARGRFEIASDSFAPAGKHVNRVDNS